MTTPSSKTGKISTRTPSRKSDDEFDLLWNVLPHPPGSVVRLFARSGDHREGDFARSAKEIRHFAKTYPDHQVYIAPNPTNARGGTRHAAKDVTHWSYFLIDMDPVCACNKGSKEKCETCRGKAKPREALDQAILWLGEWMGRDLTKHMPITIDSGRGYQAWIRLEDVPCDDLKATFHPENIDRSVARRVNGYWLKRLDEKLGVIYGCRIDTSVSDLPRVMRCPGSVNQKTKKKARLVQASSHIFTGVARLLVLGTPSVVLSDPEPTVEIKSGQSWQAVFPHLTVMAQVYLTQGKEEPGRHKVMWHTAKKLRELGVVRAEAARALVWANKLKGKDSELPLDQVKHAINTAYGS